MVIDPQLTTQGENEAKQAHDFVYHKLGALPNISLSSSLTRAMQTAGITFAQTVHVADFIPEVIRAFVVKCKSQQRLP